MQDFPNTTDKPRLRSISNGDSNDRAHSREGDLASDKLGIPLLSEDPAPLSDALGLPTLINDAPDAKKDPAKDVAPPRQFHADPAPLRDHTPAVATDRTQTNATPDGGSLLRPLTSMDDDDPNFDRFGRSRSDRSHSGPQNTNRATTPAGEPRRDAASLIGVPFNHQQTPLSGRLATLDKAAVVLGAIITIGPLFAAMIGRLAL